MTYLAESEGTAEAILTWSATQSPKSYGGNVPDFILDEFDSALEERVAQAAEVARAGGGGKGAAAPDQFGYAVPRMNLRRPRDREQLERSRRCTRLPILNYVQLNVMHLYDASYVYYYFFLFVNTSQYIMYCTSSTFLRYVNLTYLMYQNAIIRIQYVYVVDSSYTYTCSVHTLFDVCQVIPNTLS